MNIEIDKLIEIVENSRRVVTGYDGGSFDVVGYNEFLHNLKEVRDRPYLVRIIAGVSYYSDGKAIDDSGRALSKIEADYHERKWMPEMFGLKDDSQEQQKQRAIEPESKRHSALPGDNY